MLNLLNMTSYSLKFNLHCFRWLKFHFGEPENSRLFAKFLVPIGGIIYLGQYKFFLRLFDGFNMYRLFEFIFQFVFLFTGYFPSICVNYSVSLQGAPGA